MTSRETSSVFVRAAAHVGLVMFGLATGVRAEHPLFSSNHMALIDGKPRLIIGLYEHLRDDERLSEIAEAGFNLIHCPADSSALDRVHQHGLYAWINLGGALDLRGDIEAKRAKLVATVNRFKNHPALLVWEGPDEPLWNVYWSRHQYFVNEEFAAMEKAAGATEGRREVEALIGQCRRYYDQSRWAAFDTARDAVWKQVGKAPPRPGVRMSTIARDARQLGDGLTRGFKTVRETDPDHILWLNHAPRNSLASLRHFNRAVDMAGCDIYPAPFNLRGGHSDLRDRNLTSVGAYTDRMRRAAPGKAVAMVLQGFGWQDLRKNNPEIPDIGRRPTHGESQFMAYQAIVHGASAVLFWGTAYIEKTSDLWRDLLGVARELRALEPVIVAPPVVPAPRCVADESFGSIDDQVPIIMLKNVGKDYVLIAVNEQVHGVSFTVSGLPHELDGRTLYNLTNEESVMVAARTFHSGIRALDVHVFATSRRFAPPEKRGLAPGNR